MSVGSTLLQLQELDLGLARDRESLAKMPEVAELAKKRRAYQKLKTDATRLFARRKDLETYISELDDEEFDTNNDIELAQMHTDTSDYRGVQQLEEELTSLAKKLDKIRFDRAEYRKQLDELLAKQKYLEDYIAKFEASVVADTRAAREKAAGLQESVKTAERKRAALLGALPEDMRTRYEDAAKRFRGLAVERLEGNVPSICRTALQASSMSDLSHAQGIAECPYCHRILVIGEGDEDQ